MMMETFPFFVEPDEPAPMRKIQDLNHKKISVSRETARKRATLTSELAQEIFLARVIPEDDYEFSEPRMPRLERSVVVSEIYGVSPKAVRDVWNRSVPVVILVISQCNSKSQIVTIRKKFRASTHWCTIPAGEHGGKQPNFFGIYILCQRARWKMAQLPPSTYPLLQPSPPTRLGDFSISASSMLQRQLGNPAGLAGRRALETPARGGRRAPCILMSPFPQHRR
jgi:hypothetical protein